MKHLFFIALFSVIRLSVVWGQEMAADSVQIGLQQALREATANNEHLKMADTRVRGAEAALRESRGASLPQLDAVFSYTYVDIVPGFRNELLGNIEHDLLPKIAVSQPLYTGGRLSNNRKTAEAELELQRLSLRNEELGVKLSVSLAYYQLLSLNNQIGILQESQRQLQVHQQYARLLVQAGRMSELELHRLAVELAAVDGRLLKLRDDYRQLSNDLSLLLGRDEQPVYVPTDTLRLEGLAIDTTHIVRIAVQNNPDWKKLEWEQRRAEAQINSQQAARRPQVSATAWYGYEFGLESFSFSKNDRYFVGLNAQMPLFDGGVIAAKIDQAQSRYEHTQWQREYMRKALAAQVQNLYLRLREMDAQVAIQQQAVEQADQSYRLALIEYNAGRRSNTDLLDIQKSLMTSELNLNEAIVNHNKSRAQLLYILGVL